MPSQRKKLLPLLKSDSERELEKILDHSDSGSMRLFRRGAVGMRI
jgi:hypothetical protein